MEGQEICDSDPHQGNSKTIWPFAHIPMYVGLRVISMYIHENGFKSCVWKIMNVLGMILETSKVQKWSKESAEGQGRP